MITTRSSEYMLLHIHQLANDSYFSLWIIDDSNNVKQHHSTVQLHPYPVQTSLLFKSKQSYTSVRTLQIQFLWPFTISSIPVVMFAWCIVVESHVHLSSCCKYTISTLHYTQKEVNLMGKVPHT